MERCLMEVLEMPNRPEKRDEGRQARREPEESGQDDIDELLDDTIKKGRDDSKKETRK